MIRTRFAPSPTGYLHLGGARTALYSWAYARRHGGKFILRIEDTDLERSTDLSVRAILDGMQWLALDYDEGPVYQMQRLARYREVADQLINDGHAYPCYATREELEVMREAQRARGDKPRYDGRWRPENVKANGLTPPAGAKPVFRFRNPDSGEVSFSDLIKGPITIANAELDDLVILRADGVPTYNFGVVVDDLDMSITDVIRGDDHVNNTPRQINIIRALDAQLPRYAHVPMILGPDGERLSKRHGAVSVMQYAADGYLPDAMANYLARLGWSHGDAELFSRDKLVEWFDLKHVSRSPAQFDPSKLRWMNHQYLKVADNATLAALVAPRIESASGRLAGGPPLEAVIGLLKDRAETLNMLADSAMMFYRELHADEALVAQHITEAVRPALRDLESALGALTDWSHDPINAAIQEVMKHHKLKMPTLAIPVRVAVFAMAQTPALAHVLALAGRKRVLDRLQRHTNT
ncbi:MAG: glutamate--tRNA ligase [Betaproteobacteria bacterium]|nr:glutamate--tRNA ligase [Betaproteobacteria bacterium]